jgi:hypothetical protein
MVSPAAISAPRTLARCIARASFGWPSMVTARWSSISARNPSVLAFAMLLAMTRWLSIDARMPDSAVWMRRSISIRSAG